MLKNYTVAGSISINWRRENHFSFDQTLFLGTSHNHVVEVWAFQNTQSFNRCELEATGIYRILQSIQMKINWKKKAESERKKKKRIKLKKEERKRERERGRKIEKLSSLDDSGSDGSLVARHGGSNQPERFGNICLVVSDRDLKNPPPSFTPTDQTGFHRLNKSSSHFKMPKKLLMW